MKRLIKQTRRFLALSLIGLLTLLGMSPFYIYEQFNSEEPIARLAFQQVGNQQYIAELSTGDFCQHENYAIFGDQWQLDASFMKWKGPAVLMGFDSRYRLDRLQGRYRNAEQQNSSFNLSHGLSPEVLLDIFAEDEVEGESGFLVDTSYGSSVYLDIDVSFIYTIYKTEDGLIAKASARARAITNNGELTIEINRACGNEPGVIDNFSQKLNRLATSLMGSDQT